MKKQRQKKSVKPRRSARLRRQRQLKVVKEPRPRVVEKKLKRLSTQ